MKVVFRYFIRKNFPNIEVSNNEIDFIGINFHEYLNNKLNDEQKALIIPENEIEVIKNMDHPLKINGFHPAYLGHFQEYLKNKIAL